MAAQDTGIGLIVQLVAVQADNWWGLRTEAEEVEGSSPSTCVRNELCCPCWEGLSHDSRICNEGENTRQDKLNLPMLES